MNDARSMATIGRSPIQHALRHVSAQLVLAHQALRGKANISANK